MSDNIVGEMWEKVAFLCTLASMTCLMRASVGDILVTPDGSALLKRAFEANALIAAKSGHLISDAFRARAEKILGTVGAPSPPPCCATSNPVAAWKQITSWVSCSARRVNLASTMRCCRWRTRI